MMAFFGAIVLALLSAPPSKICMIAHRGGVVDEQRPENTLSSLEEAIRQHYGMVEIDVRRSKDGELVLSHDNDLARIYGVHKKVSDLTWDEIRQIRSPISDQAPPSLREYAACCRGRMLLMIDTEENGGGGFFEKMEQILRENDLLSGAFFIGSGPQKAYFKDKARVGISRGELEKAVAAGEPVSKRYFLFGHGNTLTVADVKYAQSLDVPVVASVNTYHYLLDHGRSTPESDIQHLRQWGVTYFQIDSVYAPLLSGDSREITGLSGDSRKITGLSGRRGDAAKLNVLCGSSMSEPVKKVADAFQRDTGVQVELTLGGCEVLLPQVELGAPADVFVGHAPFADKLKEKGLREDRLVVVGALRPTLVVAKGNPKDIHSLADLAREGLRVGLPDARYSTCGEMFEKGAGEAHLLEGIQQRVVYTSRAHQELATALRTDNVDAVIVWNFIAAMHREAFDEVLMEIDFPSAAVFATALKKAANPESAAKFLDYLERADVRAVFQDMGYGGVTPPAHGAVEAAIAPAKLMFYCAAGIKKPADELVELFKVRHPGMDFETTYGGCGALLAQIELAKVGDLYLSGDEFFMKAAVDKKLVSDAKQVAVFTPVVAVPKGNPAKLATFQDLAKPGIRLGMGDEKVTACGHAARAYLDRLGLRDQVEKNVVVTTATVDLLAVQCASGNLDAAIIWDGTASMFRDRLDIVATGGPESSVGVLIGVLSASKNKDAARAFMNLMASPEGASIFKKYGMVPPPTPPGTPISRLAGPPRGR